MNEKENKKLKKEREKKQLQELSLKFKEDLENLKCERKNKLQELQIQYEQKIKEYKNFEEEVRKTQNNSKSFSRKSLYEAIHNKWISLKKWKEAETNYINEWAKEEYEELNKKYYGKSLGNKKLYMRKFIKELKMVRWPNGKKMKKSMIIVLVFTLIFTLITLAITTIVNIIITSLGG
ncbi:preprotein translocase subunit SecE [Mycoplasma phocimorsus]|uniref:preprotein translocase subunit SecE n=1 Tax=Mycoplasma phocimorsus TaxID=3045839 RepID=UPI0024BFBF45|nr:preprotein translocase subunit SecE [Mycoplasma phocimorsus]MDJ1646350.1 preprotein translocase subunit SecE [Mycoplasma phocimorsus]